MLIYLKLGKKYLAKISMDFDFYKKMKLLETDKLFIVKSYLDSIFEDIKKNESANGNKLQKDFIELLENFNQVDLETSNPNLILK